MNELMNKLITKVIVEQPRLHRGMLIIHMYIFKPNSVMHISKTYIFPLSLKCVFVGRI